MSIYYNFFILLLYYILLLLLYIITLYYYIIIYIIIIYYNFFLYDLKYRDVAATLKPFSLQPNIRNLKFTFWPTTVTECVHVTVDTIKMNFRTWTVSKFRRVLGPMAYCCQTTPIWSYCNTFLQFLTWRRNKIINIGLKCTWSSVVHWTQLAQDGVMQDTETVVCI